MITIRKQHRRYDKYRDSGVWWLGNIPRDWGVGFLKNSTRLVNRGNSPEYSPTDYGIPIINQACIYWDGINFRNIKFQDQTDVSKWKGKLEKGDVLINSTGTGTLGRVAIFDKDEIYIADGHVTIIRTRQNNLVPQFIKYLLQTPIYQGYIYAALVSGSTNQIELSREGLRRMNVILPSPKEQSSIASYLDEKCALIDSIILKKQRQMKLLKEKRSAIINRAVTRGLDEGVEMKDSGVEWIGEIPKGWEVINMKYLAFFQNGFSFSSDTYVEEGLPIVRIGDIGKPYIDLNGLRKVPSNTKNAIQSFKIKQGDILLALTGATIGKSTLCNTDEEMYLNQRVAILRSSNRISNKFLDLIIRSDYFQEKIKVICFGGAQDNIGKPDIGRIPVFLPSIDQQSVIIAETEKLLRLQEEVLAMIDNSLSLLTEYKTSLIAHAVTGRIKVA